MSGIPTPDTGPAQIDPLKSFNAVLRRLPVEQQAIIEGVTNGVNPAAGADFLAETPQQETLPLLFSLLIAGDISTRQKAQALSNIRAALVHPSSSGLSKKIAKPSELFFDNLVVKAAQKTTGFEPTPKTQQYLREIFSNFQTERTKYQAKTLAGENLDIFKSGTHPLDYAHFLEAVIAGALDKKFPEDFRKTLVRTLLFAASNPSFFTDLIFAYASYKDTLQIGDLLPRIMHTETSQQRVDRERKEEVASLRTQLDETRTQFTQRVRVLEEMLAQARTRRPSSSERAGVQRDPFEVLRIPQDATPKDILSAYRELSMAFHPDIINAILEKAKMGERQAKGFRDIATNRMTEINQAFEELKRQGRT